MTRLELFLDAYDRSDLDSSWSRTATMAYAIHGIYNGLEDVMTDIARLVDGSVPKGADSHQALLDQMHVALDGVRPAFLDDELYADLVELKAFRPRGRHHYGIDLVPAKVEAKLALTRSVVMTFDGAVSRMAEQLDATG